MPTIDPEGLRLIRDAHGCYALQRLNTFDRTLHSSIVFFSTLEEVKKLHTLIGKFLVEQSRA